MTVEDRQLLELAAKAAGVVVESWTTYGPYVGGLEGCIWNPLLDDGDALRLAVKLNLRISIECENAGVVEVDWDFDDAGAGREEITENAPIGGDDYAATRRAIVRAAAKIGAAKIGGSL